MRIELQSTGLKFASQSAIQSQLGNATHEAATSAPSAPIPSSVYLDSLDLVVNAEFHFLTCQICQVALSTEEVRGHLAKTHGRHSTYNNYQFNLALGALKVAADLPTNITGPRPRVEGLKVHDGVACDNCHFLSRSKDNLRKHHGKEHPMV
ncbi:hypothetical protein M404DRAFT_135476, partial [Pisolithus tinctorius Marx 270]